MKRKIRARFTPISVGHHDARLELLLTVGSDGVSDQDLILLQLALQIQGIKPVELYFRCKKKKKNKKKGRNIFNGSILISLECPGNTSTQMAVETTTRKNKDSSEKLDLRVFNFFDSSASRRGNTYQRSQDRLFKSTKTQRNYSKANIQILHICKFNIRSSYNVSFFFILILYFIYTFANLQVMIRTVPF